MMIKSRHTASLQEVFFYVSWCSPLSWFVSLSFMSMTVTNVNKLFCFFKGMGNLRQHWLTVFIHIIMKVCLHNLQNLDGV